MRRKARLCVPNQSGELEAHTFVDQIIVGRRAPRAKTDAHVILVDKKVSGRHCIIAQSDTGTFVIRDVSRNGVRVDGRRIIPNVELPIDAGAVITVGPFALTLQIDEPVPEEQLESDDLMTEASVGETPIAVLVGDIRGYTTLSQQYPPTQVAETVRRVFERLASLISQHRGTVKEYQGDAVVAFWEGDMTPPFQFALDACRAALALNDVVPRMARDPALWAIEKFPLQMEFGLASGLVSISTVGGSLAIVGDAINYAFRLEKLANDHTGPIISCSTTHLLVQSQFDFQPLGPIQVKGRATPEPIFSLLNRKS